MQVSESAFDASAGSVGEKLDEDFEALSPVEREQYEVVEVCASYIQTLSLKTVVVCFTITMF
jgi:hypothetical protein